MAIILNFHGVGAPNPEVPPDERPYWLSAGRFRDILDQVAALREAGRDIRITFDDGNRSDVEVAVPELSARGLSATFFVLTGRFGREDSVSERDVRTLLDMGFAVGLHGRAHVDWRRLDDAGLAEETVVARLHLAEVAGRPIGEVAIPFGCYNRRVIAHLERQGFQRIFTSDGGHASPAARIQPRTSLRADMDDARVLAILSDRAGVFTRARRAVSAFVRQRLV